LDDKERVEKILGTEYATIYFNECSQISWLGVQTAMTRLAQNIPGLTRKFYFDCNPPNKRHWAYMLFVLGRDPIDNIPVKRPQNYTYMLMNPDDNVENIGEDYITDILDSMSCRLQQRYKLGLFLDDAEGAMFKSADIAKYRLDPESFDTGILTKIVTSVDPAMSDTDKSDMHGITNIGWCKSNNHIYMLRDNSLVGSPSVWAETAISTYEEDECNLILGEVNNGGDLVETNIRTVKRGRDIKFKKVWASKGKRKRIEPVVTKMEKGEFHFVGQFPELEEEMTGWIDGINLPSPNRMDSMGWGAMHFIKAGKRVRKW